MASGAERRGSRRKGGVVLAVIVLAVAATAIAAYLITERLRGGDVPGFSAIDGRPLLAEAAERRDTIGTLALEGAASRMTFRRDDGGTWRLAERDGYPVRGGMVEDLVEHVAGMTATYVSRDTPPPYEALGLPDPFRADGPVFSVRLADGDGETLGALTIGEGLAVPGGAQLIKVFVKRADDSRVWLVEDAAAAAAVPPLDPLAWMDRQIMDVPRERIREVEIASPDGEPLVLRQDENGDVQVVGAPEGASVDPEAVAPTLAAPTFLEFEDVKAAAAVAETASPWRFSARVDGGIAYRARLYEDDDEVWAVFAAEAVPETDTDSGTATATSGAAQQAEAFNRRHGDWAYRLPSHVAGFLMVRPADLAP